MKKIIILVAAYLWACSSLFAQIPALKGGFIGPNQTICEGDTPSTLTNSVAASGGTPPITYSWESSIDNSAWTPIIGPLSASYTPGSLTQTRYFRRKAISGAQTAYSNTVAVTVFSVTKNANYILTHTYTAENDSTSVADINYYDGLGYPTQSVSIGASPENKSIISPVYYDAMQRESRKYLPYAANDHSGTYRPSALSNQVRYYNDNYGSQAGGYSYTESVYEASPLNRVTASYNVGNAFRANDKKSTFDYGTNSTNEVIRFEVNSQALETAGFYNANTLFKDTVTNEDGTSKVTYKDFLGRVVLERIAGSTDDNTVYDTYYVYDNRGNLCYVLPPKLSEAAAAWSPGRVSDVRIKDLAYIYKYDGRNRCVEKCLPGAEPIYQIYDKDDRPTMSQDGNMRSLNQWAYTEYDALSRPVQQSILLNPGDVTAGTLQNNFDTAPAYKPYNPLDSGFTEIALLTETLYDAYVYREEAEIIALTDIPVGTNIRGWTFIVTQTDSSRFVLPTDTIRSIFLNGKEWISLIFYTGDPILIDCNLSIKATEENILSLYDAGWDIPEGFTFTIKDDQDYIVTANDLPSSNETICGFDQIIAVH